MCVERVKSEKRANTVWNEPEVEWATVESLREYFKTANDEPLPTSADGVLYRKTLFGPIFFRLRRLSGRLSNRLCIWRNAFQRHQGRKRSLSAIRFGLVDHGPCFRQMPDGSLQYVVRTQIRSFDIQKLQAIYPWVDILELRIFLMGFDAGERWALGSQDTEEQTRSGS